MNKEKIIDISRPILQQSGFINSAQLFGSWSKGTQRENSDVDFLVDADPHADVMDLTQLMISLEQALGMKVDIVTRSSLESATFKDVLTSKHCVII